MHLHWTDASLHSSALSWKISILFKSWWSTFIFIEAKKVSRPFSVVLLIVKQGPDPLRNKSQSRNTETLSQNCAKPRAKKPWHMEIHLASVHSDSKNYVVRSKNHDPMRTKVWKVPNKPHQTTKGIYIRCELSDKKNSGPMGPQGDPKF